MCIRAIFCLFVVTVFAEVTRADERIEYKLKTTLRIAKGNNVVYSMSFSPDGKRLAVCGGDVMVAWDLEKDKELGRYKFYYTSSATYLSFADKGNSVVMNGEEGFVVYDLETQKRRLNVKLEKFEGRAVIASPDSKWVVVSGGYCPAIFYDAKTGKKDFALENGHWPVQHLAFTPDGKYLITLSEYTPRPRITSDEFNYIVWDVATKKRVATMKTNRGAKALAMAPDGKTLATTLGDETIEFWEIKTGKKTNSIDLNHPKLRMHGVKGMSFSPDGKLLAVTGNTAELLLFDVKTGHVVSRFEGVVPKYPDKETFGIERLSFSPDGKLLAIGTNRNTVKLIEIKRLEEEEKE
jgi:WD40 repeat protein